MAAGLLLVGLIVFLLANSNFGDEGTSTPTIDVLGVTGVPYALLLAILVAILDVVPVVGSTIAGIIVAVVAVVLAGLLAYAATRPDNFQVERSLVINAPPEKIFALIEPFADFDAALATVNDSRYGNRLFHV